MADGRAVGFSKVMQKHAGRAKERFLQNLGKADKTTDELFNTYVNNFNKQQALAGKLQKELKNYVTCVRAVQVANKGLMDTLSEIYEQEWIGYEQIPVKAQAIELIWDDFGHKLHDQVTIPLNTYLSQFSDIRNKIAKRGRKLVDYDGCRHNVEALHQTGKKRDEMKITKAREQMEEAKRLYEVLNTELNEELPALYDSRIPFLVSNLQTVFTAETVFHVENSKIYAQLSELMEKLALEHQRGAYVIRKAGSPKIQRGYRGLTLSHSKFSHGPLVHPYWSRSTVRENDIRHYEEIEFKKNTMERKSDHLITKSSAETNGGVRPSSPVSPRANQRPLSDSLHDGTPISQTPTRSGSVRAEQNASPVHHSDQRNEKDYEPVEANSQIPLVENNHIGSNDTSVSPAKNSDAKKVEELYDIPVGATTTDLPPGVLYRVRATYKYAAEDVDELAFEMGEIIRVIEYDDPEEQQEEGWLMGVKESSGEKGLFPANFTRPI